MAKRKQKKSPKKTSKKKQNKIGLIVKKIRNYIIVAILSFILGGFAYNTTYVSNAIDDVYASMKVKYSDSVQTEPDYIEEDTESIEDMSSEKNLELTLESDLRVASNVTAEDIDTMLSGTTLEGLGYAFVEAEQKYGVNSLYMLGLACLESGYGTSKYATERNNLFGWNAVDSDPDKAKTFSSKEEAILYVASKLKTNYLTEGGMYFEGYTASDIDVHYCTDTMHASKIVNIISDLTEKLG